MNPRTTAAAEADNIHFQAFFKKNVKSAKEVFSASSSSAAGGDAGEAACRRRRAVSPPISLVSPPFGEAAVISEQYPASSWYLCSPKTSEASLFLKRNENVRLRKGLHGGGAVDPSSEG